MSTTLTPDQNDRLRAAAERLVQKFGNQSAVEEATGLNQTWLSRLLNGKGGGSYRSALIIARELGVELNVLLGISRPTTTLAEFEGYSAVLHKAQSSGLYPDTVWEQVGQMIIAPLEEVTVPVLLHVAGLVQATRAKALTGTSPPPPRGGQRRSGSKLRSR